MKTYQVLGMGFQERGSENKSATYWDILKDMRHKASKILPDGQIIYEEGYWKILIFLIKPIRIKIKNQREIFLYCNCEFLPIN